MTEQSVTINGDTIEIAYSRKWSLAVIKYENMELFTSIKRTVPIDADLTKVGEEISDALNELQSTDLNWARDMTNNPGSLITKIVP